MLFERIDFGDNLPLRCLLSEVKDYPFHMHDDALEILFVLDGSCELTVVNNAIPLREGDIYISCPRELHRLCAYADTHGATIMVFYINVEAYREEFPDLRSYQFANSALENNRTGIRILANYLKNQLPRLLDGEADRAYYKEVGNRILNVLIKEFQCYYLGSGFPEFTNVYKGNDIQMRRIRRVTDYIYRNYNKPIKIEDLAEMEHISANHLSSILKNGCGVGFRTFLNLARVEKSAAMLLDTDKSLQAIAYECGFSKYKYFCDSFLRSFRTTPQKYRQKYQKHTIGTQPRLSRVLEGDELELFVRRFCIPSEKIQLDLHKRGTESLVSMPVCIRLDSASYDHAACFPLLRQIRAEIPFQAIGLDVTFLRNYLHSPRKLDYILGDLWSLRAGLRVYLPFGESMRGLKECLEALREWLPMGAMLEFVFVSGSDAEDASRVRPLLDYLRSQQLSARVADAPAVHSFQDNPLLHSGYLPCYLLHKIASNPSAYHGDFSLLDVPGRQESGCPALFTRDGIKQPIYHLFYLIAQMGCTLFGQGDMYRITRQSGREDFQILLYHYDSCFDSLFEGEDEVAGSVVFTDLMALNHNYARELTVRLQNSSGAFAVRRYRFAPEQYDIGPASMELMSDRLSAESLRVLNRTLEPEMSLRLLDLDGSFTFSTKLAPFEIVLICFEKL